MSSYREAAPEGRRAAESRRARAAQRARLLDALPNEAGAVGLSRAEGFGLLLLAVAVVFAALCVIPNQPRPHATAIGPHRSMPAVRR